MSGVLERIAATLDDLADEITDAVTKSVLAALAETNGNTPAATTANTVADTPAPRSKKKAAGKKRAKRGAEKLTTLEEFKKKLIATAEVSGVDDPYVKLKEFMVNQGFDVSDNVPEDQRDPMIAKCIAYYKELSGEVPEEAEEEFEI